MVSILVWKSVRTGKTRTVEEDIKDGIVGDVDGDGVGFVIVAVAGG